MNLTPIEAGRKIGWLISYLIPEIILGVFSFGIGTAVKIGAQALVKVMRVLFSILGKAVKVTIQAIKMAARAIDNVIDAIKSIGRFFIKKGNKQVSGFFEKLEELFKKFKEFLERKKKTPDTNKPDTDLPNDKDKLPENEKKKSSDGDETKESDKLDESSLDDKKIGDEFATSGDELLTLNKKNLIKASEEILQAAKRRTIFETEP